MRDSQFARRMEAAVDIAMIAGANMLDSDDSREDVQKIIGLAEEFEQHRVCPPDGEETYFGKNYMEAIEAFAVKKMALDPEDKSRARKWRAMRDFLDVWTDGQLAYDIGPRLNCAECEALVALFRAHDCHDTAQTLLEGHAAEDEEGDDPEHIALRDRLEIENQNGQQAERAETAGQVAEQEAPAWPALDVGQNIRGPEPVPTPPPVQAPDPDQNFL